LDIFFLRLTTIAQHERQRGRCIATHTNYTDEETIPSQPQINITLHLQKPVRSTHNLGVLTRNTVLTRNSLIFAAGVRGWWAAAFFTVRI
jgi:hypothetical protein